jgi:WD40 repeat protein
MQNFPWKAEGLNELLMGALQTGDLLQNVHAHDEGLQVTDLQWAPDRTYFITASKDKTAKVGLNTSIRLLALTLGRF